MDFSYFVFRVVFRQIKNFMEFQYRKRRKALKLPEGVKKSSYVYSPQGSKEHECNLYTPFSGNCEKLPLIIDIHGGCWVHGDKDVYDCFNYDLVLQGNAVSTLTYRTIDQVGFREQVQDIFHYLHFLHDKKEMLGISTDNIMLTGDSAGAQLSLLVTAINQSARLQEVFRVRPVPISFSCLTLSHSVCFVDQAASLHDNPWLSKKVAIPGLLKMMYGEQYASSSVYANSVNPECFINGDTKLPPILLVTSEGDKMFKYQTLKLARFFDRQNIPYQLYIEKDENADHIYNILDPFARAARRCNTYMVDFFHRQKLMQA